MSDARNLILTESQAACLIALRHCKDSQSTVAIEAKLDLAKTATALRALARLGLAGHDQTKRWHATSPGKTCRFETVPDRARRNNGLPGPGGRRLLELLDRPMRGQEIAEKLRISRQRVHQLLIEPHALGCVNFGDPQAPFLDRNARG
jgi:DNA-binding IclR family transcriptional regulator